MYANKKILITGGTGTIGYHLTKRLLMDNPSVIRIYSRDEYKQFNMSIDFQEHTSKLRFLIGDVRDRERLARAMEGIDFVFHLAAMKHVPACEYNPFEAVQTNVLGTQNVIDTAIAAGVKKVLFSSTDKAIAPSNVYGTTKLTAERLISAAHFHKGPRQAVFSSVRFGNVMGSRGSVIPLFKHQIQTRSEVTITDKKMKRYMMTPNQAITLILKANELAMGGEVFVLKMPVIQLLDLTELLIEEHMSNTNARHEVIMREIGLRPGEKMYEQLMTADETYSALETDDMYIIPSNFSKKHATYPDAYPIRSTSSIEDLNPIPKSALKEWLVEERLL